VRRSDFIPLVLIGGIAAFIVVQGVKVRRGLQRRASPERAATVAPQGTANAPEAAGASGATRANSDGLMEVRRSAEPPPERDELAIRMQIRDNASVTYVLDVLAQQNQMLMRWPDRRMNALRVWIDRGPDVTDWEPQYSVVAERVFDEWREAGFPLAFDIVPDSTRTDIKIKWVTRFSAADGRRIGVTSKSRDQYGWLRSAEVVIALHDSEGERIPPAIIAGIARHEVGHALGLGHSGNSSDVMYPESRTPIISSADRATLHLIYTLPPGVVK
jgi:matrixin